VSARKETGCSQSKRIGILYQPKVPAAVTIAKELAKVAEGLGP
jgi:ABC-type uncharacterized transport system substrate-binding protein